MGRYQTLGSIATFLLFVGFIVGQGANEYVDYGKVPAENITSQDLEVPIAEFDDSRYTYFNGDAVVVNKTEYENRGVLDPDIPNAVYNPNLENIETIVVNVSLPKDHYGGMSIGQGNSVRPLFDGVNRIENLRSSDAEFRVRWEATNSTDSTLNATLNDARLSTEPVESTGFINNIQDLISVTTGYPFFNEVVLGVITIVLGLIILVSVADSLPFF